MFDKETVLKAFQLINKYVFTDETDDSVQPDELSELLVTDAVVDTINKKTLKNLPVMDYNSYDKGSVSDAMMNDTLPTGPDTVLKECMPFITYHPVCLVGRSDLNRYLSSNGFCAIETYKTYISESTGMLITHEFEYYHHISEYIQGTKPVYVIRRGISVTSENNTAHHPQLNLLTNLFPSEYRHYWN